MILLIEGKKKKFSVMQQNATMLLCLTGCLVSHHNVKDEGGCSNILI